MNKYRNMLVVYAEDDAVKELADAFFCDARLDRSVVSIRSCKGWNDTCRTALADNEIGFSRGRKILVVIDLDKDPDRINKLKEQPSLKSSKNRDAVFFLGWSGNVEQLKGSANCAGKGFAKLGEKLVDDCLGGCVGIWQDTCFDSVRSDFPHLREKLLPLIFQSGTVTPMVSR